LCSEILKKYHFLVDLDINIITSISNLLNIQTQFFRSSDFNIHGERSIRLLKLCQKMDANIYKSGISAKDYLDVNLFNESGIMVEWQNFNINSYAQKTEKFMPCVSIIDLIFNVGRNSLNYIRD
jgi:hypothetical protein